VRLRNDEIREALDDRVCTIINAIRVALEQTPRDLSANISDRGIVLTDRPAAFHR
jgi:rod shape-determining protein MreB and related proteins